MTQANCTELEAMRQTFEAALKKAKRPRNLPESLLRDAEKELGVTRDMIRTFLEQHPDREEKWKNRSKATGDRTIYTFEAMQKHALKQAAASE